MDLLKRKLGRGKKGKSKDAKKTKSKSKLTKIGKTKAKKKGGRNKKSDEDSSSGSNSDSDRRRLMNAKSSANIDAKFKMAGQLRKKPDNPPDFHKKLLEAEYSEMFKNSGPLTSDDCCALDEYLKRKCELQSSDHVVISEKVSDEEKKSRRLKIVTKYDEGRFGAIYIVQSESAVDNEVVSITNGLLIMKAALRNFSSNAVTLRLTREIRVLSQIAPQKNEQTRLPSLLFEGRVLGVPFFVIPLYDPNLEKCREEMGGYVSFASAFFISQEILLGIKSLHKKAFIHRDIKPTNIVLNADNKNQWIIIDFGETIVYGKTTQLSPPDGYTLPYLSREAHEIMKSSGSSTYMQDIESWFYILMDLFYPLPWKDSNNIENVLKTKKKFWEDLDKYLAGYPAQVLQIAKLMRDTKLEAPYNELSKLLGDGYMATKEADWKADWVDRAATNIYNTNNPRKPLAGGVIINGSKDDKIQEPDGKSVSPGGKVSKENVTASVIMDPPVTVKQFERSMYCDVNLGYGQPVAAAKKGPKYKPRKK